MGVGQQLKAQEEFLKLDSVVVLQGQLVYQGVNYNIKRHLASDSIKSPSNGIIKVRNVILDAREVKTASYSPYSDLYASSDLGIESFNCQLNGITILNINDMVNGAFFGRTGGEAFKLYSAREVNLIQSEDIEFIIESKYYDTASSSDMEFRYRIELVYYSYEN
jgi:hypothetical protein